MAEIDLQFRLDMLPMMTSLPSGRKVVVDHMTDRQITETYGMVEKDASNGLGFAVDEYVTEEDFRDEVCEGFGFVVLNEDKSELISAFFIIRSRFCRDGRAADPIVIVREDQRGQKLGEFCSKLVMQFAPKLGFLCIYFDIFTNNKAMLHIVHKLEGLTRVGHLPYSGRLGDTGKIIGSDVFFYSFTKQSNNI